jgi:hypothetical protein
LKLHEKFSLFSGSRKSSDCRWKISDIHIWNPQALYYGQCNKLVLVLILLWIYLHSCIRAIWVIYIDFRYNGNVIQLLLMYNSCYSGFDYTEKTLSYLSLQSLYDIYSWKVSYLQYTTNNW